MEGVVNPSALLLPAANASAVASSSTQAYCPMETVSTKQLLWMGTCFSLFGGLTLLLEAAESLRETVHVKGQHLPLGVVAILMLVSGVALIGLAGISASRSRRKRAPSPTVEPPVPAELHKQAFYATTRRPDGSRSGHTIQGTQGRQKRRSLGTEWWRLECPRDGRKPASCYGATRLGRWAITSISTSASGWNRAAMPSRVVAGRWVPKNLPRSLRTARSRSRVSPTTK